MALAGGETAPLLLALLSFVLGGSALGWTGLYLTVISESVPTESAATAVGTSMTVGFAGMFLAAPLFGLVADITGAYEES
jgi:MFS family permease